MDWYLYFFNWYENEQIFIKKSISLVQNPIGHNERDSTICCIFQDLWNPSSDVETNYVMTQV